MKSRVALLFILLVLPLSSHAADFYLEPYLGYHTNATFHFSSSKAPIASGSTYGARVGMDYSSLLLGIDYMSGSWGDDASPKDTIVPQNWGVFVGYVFPTFFKVYGTYFFDAKYKFSSDTSSHDYGGTEFKFGIAVTAIPIITLNVEYGIGTLNIDNGQFSTSNVSESYFGIVIGVPIEF